MVKPQISIYQDADQEACMQAFISNVPKFFTNEEVKEFAHFLASYLSKSSSIKTYYFVVKIEDKIIGCGGYGDKDGTGIISLAWGLIHADFQKQGFGADLLKFRLEQIKKNFPNTGVVIDTTQFSFGFFEKYGFVTQKITYDFYEPGMHRYDMVYKN